MILYRLFTLVLAAFTLASAQTAPNLPRQNDAKGLKDRYLALTRGWAEEAQFTAAEERAMEEGRKRERGVLCEEVRHVTELAIDRRGIADEAYSFAGK